MWLGSQSTCHPQCPHTTWQSPTPPDAPTLPDSPQCTLTSPTPPDGSLMPQCPLLVPNVSYTPAGPEPIHSLPAPNAPFHPPMAPTPLIPLPAPNVPLMPLYPCWLLSPYSLPIPQCIHDIPYQPLDNCLTLPTTLLVQVSSGQ